MNPVLYYELSAVYSDLSDSGRVVFKVNEQYVTYKEAFRMLDGLLEDRQNEEALSWVLREIYIDGSAVMQHGEVSDHDTHVEDNVLPIAGRKAGYKQ